MAKKRRRRITIVTQQKQTIADLELEVRRLEAEIIYLKEILFCCGEVAVGNFDNTVVGLADRTLKGFKIPEKRYREILQSLSKNIVDSSRPG